MRREKTGKASQKLHALSRISIFMVSKKIKLIIKTFVLFCFNHCPLIWVFHDRKIDNKLAKYSRELLELHAEMTFIDGIEYNSVSMHQKNLQLLIIEIYKTKNRLNPSFVLEVLMKWHYLIS